MSQLRSKQTRLEKTNGEQEVASSHLSAGTKVKPFVTGRAPPLLWPRTLWEVLTLFPPAPQRGSGSSNVSHPNPSRAGSSALIWPRFTRLNIETNYNNDANEGLMTVSSFPGSAAAAGESQGREVGREEGPAGAPRKQL